MGFWEPLVFWILAAGALASSTAVLLFRNPLYSALALIGDFFCFAGLYVLLSAHFMAVTQVLVYGGAIMVLFLFIIMLLNLSDEDLGPRRFSLHQVLAGLAAAAVFVFAASSVVSVVDFDKVASAIDEADTQRDGSSGESKDTDTAEPLEVSSAVDGLDAFANEAAVQADYADQIDSWDAGQATYATDKYPRFDSTRPFVVPPVLLESQLPEDVADTAGAAPRGRTSDERDEGTLFGTVEPISLLLVNRFVVPFELTAILLLAAIVGAVIIAKKRL